MTVSSDVDICNLTLDLLDQAPISDIETPVTSTEEIFSRWYDQTRKQALRRHPWNFAAKRAIFAPNATAPVFGWSKAFDLPADYIRIMHINESVIVHDSPIPQSLYTVEGGQILIGDILNATSADELRLVYVSDFTNVPRMDASFIDYLHKLLALNVAYKITQSNSTVQRMAELVKDAESVARSMSGQENPPIRVERSSTRRARRNTGGVQNLDGIMSFR